METMFSNGMCRCCASEGTFKDLSTKYRWMGVEEVYSDMLRECFDVTLSIPDESPECGGGICEVCITQLRNAANFKKQVLNTEEQFKRMLQNKSFKSNIVKVEVNPPDDEVPLTDEDNNLSNDDFSSTEYEVPIKMESSEEGKTRKRSKAGPSRAKQPKTEPDGKRRKKRKLKVISIVPKQPPAFKLKRRKEVNCHQENVRSILTWTNATPLRCRGRYGYACSFCIMEFPEPADLKTHTISTHEDGIPNFKKGQPLPSFFVKLDITNLHCKICKQPINFEDIAIHLIAHGKLYHTHIDNHIVPFNFESEQLKCAVCENEFNNFKVLLEHMNKHYSNYVCEICSAGFVNKRMLQNHSYRHLKGEFQCSYCAKIFDTRVKMKDHTRAVHILNNKRSKCGYCEERFSDYAKKQVHEAKVHGVKAVIVKCQACDKTFRSQRALGIHVKFYHMLGQRRGKKGEIKETTVPTDMNNTDISTDMNNKDIPTDINNADIPTEMLPPTDLTSK